MGNLIKMSPADESAPPGEDRAIDADSGIMRRAIQDQEQQIQSMGRTLDRLRVDILRRDQQLAAFRVDIVKRDEQLVAFRVDIVKRDEQLAAFRVDIVKRDEQLAAFRVDIARRDEQLAALWRRLSELDGLNRQLAGEMQSVLTSTSWRAMQPVRIILARSPRLARAARRFAKLIWWTVTLQLPARLRERRARNK